MSRLDVFHQQNLRKILGITWKDKITNEEVLKRQHRDVYRTLWQKEDSDLQDKSCLPQ